MFAEHDSLSLAKISELAGISEEICEKRIQFWVHKGILIKGNECYRCVRDDEDVVEAGPEEQMDTEDNEQEKAKAEQEAKFQVSVIDRLKSGSRFFCSLENTADRHKLRMTK